MEPHTAALGKWEMVSQFSPEAEKEQAPSQVRLGLDLLSGQKKILNNSWERKEKKTLDHLNTFRMCD